jgi:hypothetical protein
MYKSYLQRHHELKSTKPVDYRRNRNPHQRVPLRPRQYHRSHHRNTF